MVCLVTKIYGDNYVQINTEIGELCGKWCSSSQVSIRKYNLEFDCSEVLTSDCIQMSNFNSTHRIDHNGNLIYLYGFVEEVQEGVLFFRLQKDIMMFEVAEELDCSMFVGSFVCILISKINFYDTDE